MIPQFGAYLTIVIYDHKTFIDRPLAGKQDLRKFEKTRLGKRAFGKTSYGVKILAQELSRKWPSQKNAI